MTHSTDSTKDDFYYEKDDNNIVTITMDMQGKSANTMDDSYIPAMELAVSRLEQDLNEGTLSGVIITSAKDTFFAGGDLNSLLALKEEDRESFFTQVETVKSQLRRLETLKVPVVAAINGAALGGGYEIALACHHRIAIDNKAIVGLPEVQLGLLPGGGGTVRLIRKLGLLTAFPILTEGKQFKAEAALAMTLIDDVADSAESMIQKAKAWISENPNAQQPWDMRGFKIPGGSPSNPKIVQMLAIAPSIMRSKTKGLMPAPEAIMSAGVEGAQVDFDTALRIESRYFVNLVLSPVAKNMISTFFFGLNKLNSGASRPKNFERNKVKKVGVLGAGMMGAGIAYCAARAGIEVVLKDVSQENAEKGKSYSDKVLTKQVSRNRLTTDKKEQILSRILATDKAEDLSGCDLVIEAVFESVKLKHQVAQEVENIVNSDAVIASNTSTLPITELAKGVNNSENFIGLHFFSPVDKMPLVEIICGKNTSDSTLAKAFDFVLQIKKTPIVVNDSRGFYTSRVFSTFLDEGAALLEDGVAPIVIENLASGAGMPVGPLAQQDEVSQRLAWEILSANKKYMQSKGLALEESSAERVVGKMVNEHERLGKAFGGGYYDYAKDGTKQLWSKLAEVFPAKENNISHDDVKERLLFRQAIESVKCLEENVLRSVLDGNIGSVFGIGFPPHTGGAFQYINSYGLNNFINRAQVLIEKYGERFTPPQLLITKAQANENF